MIPKTTTPLTKFIRTLEGIVVVVVNCVLIIVPIVTSSLPATVAVKYGAIFNMVVVASRSILKGIASLSAAADSGALASVTSGSTAGSSTAENAPPTAGDLEQGPSVNDLDPDLVHPDVDLNLLDEPGTPHDQVQTAGATKSGEGWQGVGTEGAPGGGSQ